MYIYRPCFHDTASKTQFDRNKMYGTTTTEKMLGPWSQQARHLTPRRGTVAAASPCCYIDIGINRYR